MQVGVAEEPQLQQLCPDACTKLLCEESERALNVPMQKKHAAQFASIVGHLERAGILTPHRLFPVTCCLIQYLRCAWCLEGRVHSLAMLQVSESYRSE